MKISILHTGKTNTAEIRQITDVYLKRLNKYLKVDQTELPADKIKYPQQLEIQKIKEGELQLKHIQTDDYLILLDENGKTFSSREFADFIEQKLNEGRKRMVFLSGGAYGFSDAVYQRADAKVSLSKMTFSHQLIRIVFAEQLYRAFSILHNEPYHHD